MAVIRSHAVTAAVPAAAVLAVLLAGCGGGSTELTSAGLPGDGPTRTATTAPAVIEPSGPAAARSAADLLRAARAAFVAARSVHVTGTAVRGSDAYVVDLRLKGAAGGTATIRTSGQTVEVIRIGDVAYVGGDLAFWRGVTGEENQARAMVGSFVRVPARQGNFGQFTVFTFPDVVTAVLPDPAAPATVGARTTIGGRAAIPVRDTAGGTLSVAASGPAYPLRLDGLSSGQVVFLDFTDYGADVPLVAPPVRSVVTGGPGQGS